MSIVRLKSTTVFSPMASEHWAERARANHGCFIFLAIVVLLWFHTPLFSVLEISLNSENAQHYSHISLIPFMSLYFIYLKRADISSTLGWSRGPGIAMIAAGGVVSSVADLPRNEAIDDFVPHIVAMVLMLWGSFIFCYGVKSARVASFALGLLLLLIPMPSYILNGVVGFLQRASAEASAGLFSFLDVPVHREGFTFALSNFTIEVAEECSGIRSALALLITSLIAGQLFLSSFWGKTVLVSVVVPLAIVKNAFRIVGLALLANYVDPRFITDSALHRNGGIPLFLLALIILFTLAWLLRKLEWRQRPA